MFLFSFFNLLFSLFDLLFSFFLLIVLSLTFPSPGMLREWQTAIPPVSKTVRKLGSPHQLEVLRTRKIAWSLSPHGARESAVFDLFYLILFYLIRRSGCEPSRIAVGWD